MKPITDIKQFEAARTAGQQLIAASGTRNQQFDKAEDLYFLKWKNAPTPSENFQITISPDGRDKAQGIVRLLSASEPIITVTRDGLDQSEGDTSKTRFRRCGPILPARLEPMFIMTRLSRLCCIQPVTLPVF